ncbi:hypothetical protein ACFQAS_15270 [Halopenitus salinus]|uniref:PadR family transcriptional regulator n=1 Tax=Halopenitus salinus TaxID=1198295 RepID=A0ABD5UW03_9EURY
MPSSERRDKVLAFLATHDMALPPTAIYAGLKRHEDITFGYRTVQNALSDLLDQGLVKRVNTNRLREDGQIEEIVGDDARRAYYSITEAGRDRLEDNKL